jgi:uncharacterized protein
MASSPLGAFMRWWIALGIAFFIALIVLPLSFSFLLALFLVRPARKPHDQHPRDYNIPFEDIRIPSPIGELAAWYLPGINGRTLIALHGVGDNKGQWLMPAIDLQSRGFSVLMMDFRAHGESDGRYTTFGDYETIDVLAALDYLEQRGDVDMQRVGIMGLSLGGIAAIISGARTNRIKAVMAEAAFPDLLQDIKLAFHRYTHMPPFIFANLTVFWGQLLVGTKLDKLRPLAVIDQIAPRPIFIIGDLDDNLVNEPYSSSNLYASAGEPKQLWQLPNTGHVQGYQVFKDEYITRIANFFAETL